MAKQTINIGRVANDKSGDPLRTAFDKINQNFTELYNTASADVQIPTQTTHAGKVLTTNGSTLSWTVPAEHLEIDGGYASTIYTAEITIDGGGA